MKAGASRYANAMFVLKPMLTGDELNTAGSTKNA
jgi:hypothetical protein